MNTLLRSVKQLTWLRVRNAAVKGTYLSCPDRISEQKDRIHTDAVPGLSWWKRCGYDRSWSTSFRTGKSIIRILRAASTKRSERKIDSATVPSVYTANTSSATFFRFCHIFTGVIYFVLSREWTRIFSFRFFEASILRSLIYIMKFLTYLNERFLTEECYTLHGTAPLKFESTASCLS